MSAPTSFTSFLHGPPRRWFFTSCFWEPVMKQLVAKRWLSCSLVFFRPTPDGSCQLVYQAGKTIALCKFTELTQWHIVHNDNVIQKRTELDRYITHSAVTVQDKRQTPKPKKKQNTQKHQKANNTNQTQKQKPARLVVS